MSNALREAIEKNQSKPCTVEGCCNSRYRLYSTCVHHFFKRKLYGNPKSKAIRKRELQQDKDIVAKLVENNKQHRGIQKAITFFNNWLLDAAEGKPGTPGLRHIRRLALAEVTGKDILVISGALWNYSYRQPKYFPDNLSLMYGLSHQLSTLVPLEYATTRTGKTRSVAMNSTDRKAIGQHIVNHLGLLFVNLCHHIEQLEQEEWDDKQSFCEKFN